MWDKPQQDAFDSFKSLMTTGPVHAAYFGNTKENVLNADASATGIGAVILQGGKPNAFSSKTPTASERKYANIEREMLAIIWGAKKLHTFVYGRTVVVETDDKPLEAIFKKPLNDAPSRLQKMSLKLITYALDVQHVLAWKATTHL